MKKKNPDQPRTDQLKEFSSKDIRNLAPGSTYQLEINKDLPANDRKSEPTREELVNMIVHEIRNPLTAIKMANETISNLLVSGKAALKSFTPFTSIIARNVQEIDGLMKSLLEAGTRVQLDLGQIDICKLIDHCIEKLEDRVSLKKVRISKKYDGELFIMGDAEKLAMAFLNILVNSIEAIEERSGRIWITARQSEGLINVEIRDNGKGMDPEFVKNVLAKKTSKEKGGRGYGLTHVLEILEWHGAGIDLKSRQGKGTKTVIHFHIL